MFGKIMHCEWLHGKGYRRFVTSILLLLQASLLSFSANAQASHDSLAMTEEASLLDDNDLHLGFQLGLIGISPEFNVLHKHLFAFVNTAFLPSLISQGFRLSLTIGAGPSFPISSLFHFDLLATLGYSENFLSTKPSLIYGLVLGFRYLSKDGLTISLRLPFFGYSTVVDNTLLSIYETYTKVIKYYLGVALLSPVLSVGYTF